MRTAFSTVVRESRGPRLRRLRPRRAAWSPSRSRGTPGHINAMATGMRHFLAAYPARVARARRRADHQRPVDDRRPDQRPHRRHARLPRRPRGRLLRQHLPRARHRRPRSVGRGAARSTRRACGIPIMQALRARASRTRTLLAMIRANVRTPRRDDRRPVRAGGVQRRRRAQPAAVPGRVRPADCEELSARDHPALGAGACARRSRALPDGRYTNEAGATASTSRSALHSVVAVTIDGDEMRIDYAGSLRRRAAYGINVVLNYTHAYASFAIKAALAPGGAAQRGRVPAGARRPRRSAAS